MGRCQICDYCDTTGSTGLDEVSPRSSRCRVRYHKSLDQELCDECSSRVRISREVYDAELIDRTPELVVYEVEDIDPKDICKDAPALSESEV